MCLSFLDIYREKHGLNLELFAFLVFFFVEGKHYLVFHTCQAEIQFWLKGGDGISVSYGCAYSFGNSIGTLFSLVIYQFILEGEKHKTNQTRQSIF